MSRFRPQYQRDKIGLEMQRQRHAREAAPDCLCPFCARSADIERLLRERIDLERRLIGPPPF